jgi:hypothetical protein
MAWDDFRLLLSAIHRCFTTVIIIQSMMGCNDSAALVQASHGARLASETVQRALAAGWHA